MKAVLFVLGSLFFSGMSFAYTLEGRTFTNHVVDDELCDEIRGREPIFNCTPSLEFMKKKQPGPNDLHRYCEFWSL
jgi:hypothetical protein